MVRDTIRAANPDLIGTQEGLFAQLKDIEADLGGEYASIGLGRELRMECIHGRLLVRVPR